MTTQDMICPTDASKDLTYQNQINDYQRVMLINALRHLPQDYLDLLNTRPGDAAYDNEQQEVAAMIDMLTHIPTDEIEHRAKYAKETDRLPRMLHGLCL